MSGDPWERGVDSEGVGREDSTAKGGIAKPFMSSGPTSLVVNLLWLPGFLKRRFRKLPGAVRFGVSFQKAHFVTTGTARPFTPALPTPVEAGVCLGKEILEVCTTRS